MNGSDTTALTRRRQRDNPEEESLKDRPLDWGILVRLFGFTRPYVGKRNWLFGFVILRAVQMPILAWAVSAVINGPITNRDQEAILQACLAFALFGLFAEITIHFRHRLAMELGEMVVRDLRNAIYQKLMTLPLSYFQRTKVGRIISRITSDVESVRNGVQNIFFVSIVLLGQMIGSAVFMLYYSWELFSILLLMAPLLWVLNRHFRAKISRGSRQVQESMSLVTATIAESVKGIRVTQGFSREEVNAGIFRRMVKDHAGYLIGLNRNVAIYLPLIDLNSQFFIAGTLLVGGYGVLHPSFDMQVGDLIAFLFLSNLFFGPITSLGRQFTQALTAMAGAERVFRLLDADPDWKDPKDAVALPSLKGGVVFENISMEYDPGKPVLHEINFTAEPGQTVALVGHTGCGKSSIINLICKFYLPSSGRVLVDGHDIANARSSSLRQQLGLVLQQNFLFQGTVLENIRMGRLGATDEEVIQAVANLGVLDIVESLPNGIYTSVGERGSGLSLGQQQLICFARAFLADPKILILDEATSSVDTITEARLQTALERLTHDRTCVIVAHRLSTIRNADLVLVLDQGRIVERGSHCELLSQGDLYANLYERFVQEDS